MVTIKAKGETYIVKRMGPKTLETPQHEGKIEKEVEPEVTGIDLLESEPVVGLMPKLEVRRLRRKHGK